ncbi:hypothetical protein O181_003034 [Austropuccinia psidii MF-1]|uniref:Uncharacterized protein n=1 Tax=Austropuccinia psidii MF-1 TaxID=1389203 RepID=A0A9Q3BDE0_9BASI|nr:hypothetical protein [Austropuccinia psidii MF-1]
MSDKNNESKDSSNIPILDRLNYREWYMCTCIYLKSKDLLDLCLRQVPADATPAAINKLNKSSFEAISFISTKIDPSVFVDVMDDETMEDANLLWERINEQYASKTAINRGRAVMDGVSITYKGNLEDLIKKCCNALVDLALVNIEITPDVLSYIILGKLCNHTSMYHLADGLAMSTEATGNLTVTLNRLQNYA